MDKEYRMQAAPRADGLTAPGSGTAGIAFLGYLDGPEELLGSRRRCLYGCDSAAAAAGLPTGEGLELGSGSVTAAPAPWSVALVRGGDTLILGADGSWAAL